MDRTVPIDSGRTSTDCSRVGHVPTGSADSGTCIGVTFDKIIVLG